jgi:hypothetical protein
MKNDEKADKKVAAGCCRINPQGVGTMKVDANLTVVKDQEAVGNGPRKTARASSSGIELLISRENQQARRSDPASLTEARSLLLDVTWRLSGAPGETLAEVHLLKSPCLVRLP